MWDVVIESGSGNSDAKVTYSPLDLDKAKDRFKAGDAISKDGIIVYTLMAAKDYDTLPDKATIREIQPDKAISETSSSFGTMVLSQTEVPLKRQSAQLTISGKANGYSRGQSVEITMTKPDGTTQKQWVQAGYDGKYNAIIIIDKTFSLGQYKVQAKFFKEHTLSLSFKVVEESELVPKQESMVKTTTERVPSWIKNNAKWWSQKQIGDSDFVSGIQYMIKEKIVNIPNLPESSQTSEQKVPDWIRNNAGWWADGLITEDDFVKGIEYLVKVGIITIR